MGGRRGFGRGVEVVAERGAERRLIALLDCHAFDHRRPKAAGARLQQILQRADFGLQPLRLQRRLLDGVAGGGFGVAGLALRLVGHLRGFLRRAGFLHRHVKGFGEARRFLGAAALPGDEREFRVEPGQFRLETSEPVVLVAQRRFDGVAARVYAGDLLLRIREHGLGFSERRLDLDKAFLRLVFAVSLKAVCADEFGALLLKALGDLRRVLDQRALALKVAHELLDLAGKLQDALLRSLFVGLQRLPCGDKTVHGGAGLRLFFTQLRQFVRGDRLQLGGLGLLQRAGLDGSDVGFELLRGVAQAVRGDLIGNQRDERFVLADPAGEFAIARRLTRLSAQAVALALDLLQHVLEPGEIFRRCIQPQLSLVAARMKPGDAGGVLQNAAARLRLGGDDLPDLALAHERGRARSGCGVGEEKLHVAGADFLAVDSIGRTLLALDAAGHLDGVGVVERGRREARGIVENEADFREITGRARAAASEDHVVHAGSAHVLV